ncbi:MAG: nucleotidyltransferase family protein [Ardenticatenia bacterium]|nr:nucleotidyltransferase family protein [Ardenticatenia bacterium]
MNPFEAIPPEEMEAFCRRWKIRELALFGSVLREDFGPDSDVDILVEFEADADWSLLEHIRMQQELERLLGRKVDLISKRALKRSRNWLFRREVLNTAKAVFSQE